jgi:hypothetical protein
VATASLVVILVVLFVAGLALAAVDNILMRDASTNFCDSSQPGSG